jgi:hypothetical protein
MTEQTKAIESAVLERSEQEPVAFMRFRGKSISNMSRVITVDDFNGDYPQFMACGMTNSDLVPLYTAQQAVKAEPVTTSYAEARSALCVEANKLTAPHTVNQRLLDAVMQAYGILWNINTEPMAPIPLVDPEKAAAKARLILKETLSHEQRGTAINNARAAAERGEA